MTNIPPWIQTALITAGHLDETGNSRRARARHCTRCGLITLTGYDDDTAARLVTCDPRPLTAYGEALALTTGRYTRTINARAGRLELDKRDHWQIHSHPAGHPTNRYDVLAQHRCGDILPTTWTGPSWRTTPTTEAHDAPPF